MPLKKKHAETRGEDDLASELERETEFSASSPLSVASTASSPSPVTTEHLERVIEANQNSIAALIAALPTALSFRPAEPSAASVPVPKLARVDVPKWTEGENPSEYFSKYEQALTHNGVPKDKWGLLLQIYLSGSAQASFAQVNPLVIKDYDAVKNAMLQSLGDTPDGADKRWCTMTRQKGENHRTLYRRVHNTGFRRMHGLETKEECCQKMILSKFLTLLSADCYGSVVPKRPKNGQEAARYAQEFEEDQNFARSLQPRAAVGHHQQKYYSKREPSSNEGSTGGGSGSSLGGAASSKTNPSSGGSRNSSPNRKHDRQGQKERKPITCHGCGEPGHIRPNCPNKIRRVKSPECDSGGSMEAVDGWLAGSAVSGLRIDTGADRTIVSTKFVPESAYIIKTVILDSWRGKQFSKHKVAKMCIKVGTTEVEAEVAVSDTLDFPALLGVDLGNAMKVQLMGIIIERAQKAQSENGEKHVASVRLTRAQANKEDKEDTENQIASAESEAEPVPLEDIFDFPDAYFEQDPTPTPLEECSTLPEVSLVDVPLPTIVECDSNSLIAEQQGDSTLKELLKMAKDGERGYEFERGVLVQSTSDGLGDCVHRIVVPVGRRQSVLEMAHSNCVAGHFGVKKTFSRISSKFLWPRMWSEVKDYVRTCAGCQRASRKDSGRAPLQPLQCMEEPFQKVAFDLVSPYPKAVVGVGTS